MSQETLTLDKLESHLWESANILRGSIDSSDYKNYIFGMLFLKRISDVFDEECEKMKAEGKEAFIDDPDFHDFFVPKRARWEHISKVTQDIGSHINKAFEVLEEHNKMLEGVLAPIDFNDKERLPDHVLEELIQHFSKYSLKNRDLEDPDILGRAYEYLIRQFADDAGKKGGEFYTPRQVVKLLVEILDPRPGMSVYDPCCGSGGMLIYSAEHLIEEGNDISEISLYGQERNLNTWAICKMNMLLHGLYDAKIAKGDTMRDPQFLDNGKLDQFDRVIANPMWNQSSWSKKYLQETEPFGRFSYGFPPKNSADWVWIQHMLASANKKGKIGVVLDNGVLFRGRSEGKIRKKVLKHDLIEAVIALPSNLFYNTSSPGCILILNKDKTVERKNKVIFIYAEEDYKEGSNQNYLREKDIEKILNAYKNFEDIERYCRVVDMEEIERNDYNLNVPRYVDTTEPEEPIDVQEVIDNLNKLEEERKEIEEEMNGYLRELGYDD
ncbi:type I restriction-modification system subunit M [Halothermothrix orenii]|uniref:site-specific DNA-methyltransferase (adenine-specific) n=1 Tax=Halothermothrix orenii (strain H 168 / OCM 544 / DSM 9562) TaxID=373903 RepID=B8D1X5_HALOH|nr:class I SAM-dependent DNA methyltransferase [Halothermothrix orenii]ACL69202.1 type I restriction-modification system, M subunit [Halothermothrix orenii H 168]